jgi:pimeloyl-ACP methyl ester carboxylesterase
MVRNVLVRLCLCLVCATGLAGCGGKAPEPEPTPTEALAWDEMDPITLDSQGSFAPAECMFDPPDGIPREFFQDRLQCGYLTVPEDRGQLDSRTIRLAVAIYKSQSDTESPKPDPVVVLIGGAGPFLQFSAFMTFIFNQVNANRDLIMLEPRGTGFSEPALNCPGISDLYYEALEQDPYSYEVKSRAADLRRGCRQQWEAEGIPLTAYTTAASAEDLNDLRMALGIRQWNVFALSFSTRQAFELARSHPEGIRSMILDSAIPSQSAYSLELAANTQRSLSLFFQRCAKDSKCKEAFPDLEDVFYDLVDQLNAQPALIEAPDLNSGRRMKVLLTGDRLIDTLVMGLNLAYDDSIVPNLPRTIFQVKSGRYDEFKNVLGNLLPNYAPVDEGRPDLVLCNEDFLNTPRDKIQEANDHAIPQLAAYFNRQLDVNAEVCETLRVPELLTGEKKPATGSVPALFLSGDFTTDVPPAWGDLAASGFTPSYHAMFTFSGSFVAATNTYRDCSMRIIQHFLADPQTAPDFTCASAKQTFPWITLP